MVRLILVLTLLVCSLQSFAQRTCATNAYQEEEFRNDPGFISRATAIEQFTRQHVNDQSRNTQGNVIRIPVVVHILYHHPSEKLTDAIVHSQIAALNRDFRRKAADTSKTPSVFRALAADCEIEFQLAISDPTRRSTSGIVRKYSPITKWKADDKVKFSSEMGDDAWDPKQYLNIWVCELDQVMGYSSHPGGAENKDGIVLDFSAFGTINAMTGYNMGKTAVHEVGHWLNLKHIWGDAHCGDDLVQDTPPQSVYTVGCPSGTRISCDNSPSGNMYMNYMDFTEDACMNLFTTGQKNRMRALFAPGGVRYSLLSSRGLDAPLIFESPLPEDSPTWLHAQLFPNPASGQITLDLAYDVRWIGKPLTIFNLQGQVVIQMMIHSKIQQIDISKLQAGIYFLAAKREEGESIKKKFVKL